MVATEIMLMTSAIGAKKAVRSFCTRSNRRVFAVRRPLRSPESIAPHHPHPQPLAKQQADPHACVLPAVLLPVLALARTHN